MTCTNNIKDEVIFDNVTGWSVNKLKNDDIIYKLNEEKKTAFLSFAWRCLDYSVGLV